MYKTGTGGTSLNTGEVLESSQARFKVQVGTLLPHSPCFPPGGGNSTTETLMAPRHPLLLKKLKPVRIRVNNLARLSQLLFLS